MAVSSLWTRPWKQGPATRSRLTKSAGQLGECERLAAAGTPGSPFRPFCQPPSLSSREPNSPVPPKRGRGLSTGSADELEVGGIWLLTGGRSTMARFVFALRTNGTKYFRKTMARVSRELNLLLHAKPPCCWPAGRGSALARPPGLCPG